MAWQDDFYTDPEEIYRQYQARRFSELNGEVDRDVAAGTSGASAPTVGSGGGSTVVFNPQCFSGDTIFHLFSVGAPSVIYFSELYQNRDKWIGGFALSFDKHNRPVAGRIADVMREIADESLVVTFSDHETLRVTKMHRFLCADYEYRPIGRLLGQQVFNADGALVEVVTIEVVPGRIEVFNASIEEFKNYCVGQTKKRVHNLKPQNVE